MVDRITPVTSESDVEEVEGILGVRDAWPVVAEPFSLWVIEDHFPQGRPALEEVGALIVDNVAPYEMVKLRLLNAAHQGITYFGYLSGHRYAHEAMHDPAIAGFIMKYWDREAVPTLPPVPGFDVQGFKEGLVERFGNPEVRDTLARLCAESSDRIPKWLMPVVWDNLKAGGDIERSAAIVASWARYAEAVDEQGEPINVVDPLKDELIAIAQSQRSNPLAFIENEKLFGDIAKSERFRASYLRALQSLHDKGAHATVAALA
jgi:mannitol 2-dehydrogenase